TGNQTNGNDLLHAPPSDEVSEGTGEDLLYIFIESSRIWRVDLDASYGNVNEYGESGLRVNSCLVRPSFRTRALGTIHE
ncbi:hypothetical protein KC219_22355, partial [Mycobacterium tuberculosis]|nr:hypothetical protein [Mycobacterium tuberculosis]